MGGLPPPPLPLKIFCQMLLGLVGFRTCPPGGTSNFGCALLGTRRISNAPSWGHVALQQKAALTRTHPSHRPVSAAEVMVKMRTQEEDIVKNSLCARTDMTRFWWADAPCLRKTRSRARFAARAFWIGPGVGSERPDGSSSLSRAGALRKPHSVQGVATVGASSGTSFGARVRTGRPSSAVAPHAQPRGSDWSSSPEVPQKPYHPR